MADLILPTSSARVSPLTPEEVNISVRAEYQKTVVTWGIPNNLIRTMACAPQLALTEVDYANSFIFDHGPYVMWPRPGSKAGTEQVLFQAAGFIDPITKELLINLVSLLNRSRYSITHHSVIGLLRIATALQDLAPGRNAAKAESMLLHLVDANGSPDFEGQVFDGLPLYDEFQLSCVRFALKMHRSSHSITDDDVDKIRSVFRGRASAEIAKGPLGAQFGVAGPDNAFLDAHVNGMLVELTWCVAHFGGLLNHWFTVLRVQDESDAVRDGFDFISHYNKSVPESIKVRNNNLLGSDGWGSQ